MSRITVNLEKLRSNFIKNEVNPRRLRELEKLDVDFLRAIEEEDDAKKQDVIAKKQYLRDLPTHPDIQSATSIAELEALDLFADFE